MFSLLIDPTHNLFYVTICRKEQLHITINLTFRFEITRFTHNSLQKTTRGSRTVVMLSNRHNNISHILTQFFCNRIGNGNNRLGFSHFGLDIKVSSFEKHISLSIDGKTNDTQTLELVNHLPCICHVHRLQQITLQENPRQNETCLTKNLQ